MGDVLFWTSGIVCGNKKGVLGLLQSIIVSCGYPCEHLQYYREGDWELQPKTYNQVIKKVKQLGFIYIYFLSYFCITVFQ